MLRLTSEEKQAGRFFLENYRNKYQIQQLSVGENYRAFLIGNAPVIDNLEIYKKPGRIALVGLSGFRALMIACQLGNEKHIPKIVIVDNSEQVIDIWKTLREFAAQKTNREDFNKEFPAFLAKKRSLYRNIKCTLVPGVVYPNQDIFLFFQNLFKQYGYDYVRAIILKARLIKQTWLDTETFQKLRNHFKLHNIDHVYVFASDIVSYVNVYSATPKKDIHQILSNVALLNPCLSIHANLSTRYLKPTELYFVENADPEAVLKIIFSALPPTPFLDKSKKYTPEEEAKAVIQNIKFQIYWTPWVTQNWCGSKVIGRRPRNINKQWQMIEKAEAKKLSYCSVLAQVIQKGLEAKATETNRRDRMFTKPYYQAFENKEKLELKFRG
jgi:hypothetical protein